MDDNGRKFAWANEEDRRTYDANPDTYCDEPCIECQRLVREDGICTVCGYFNLDIITRKD